MFCEFKLLGGAAKLFLLMTLKKFTKRQSEARTGQYFVWVHQSRECCKSYGMCHTSALLAQSVEHWSCKPRVASSNLRIGLFNFLM